jgi:hypothetical protein
LAKGRPDYALGTFKSGFRTLVPAVTAEATVGGRVFRGVNEMARLGDPRVQTLIADHVAAKPAMSGGRSHPNGSGRDTRCWYGPKGVSATMHLLRRGWGYRSGGFGSRLGFSYCN